MDQTIIAHVTSLLEAIDFSEENERIVSIEAEIERLEEAVEKAEQRCTSISRELIDYRGPDARSVANALLDDVAPTQAATAGPSVEDLKQERATLRAAIGNLRERIRDENDDIREIRLLANAQVIRIVRPVVDALIEEAQAATEPLLGIYASLYAMQFGAHTGGPELNKLRQAIEGTMGGDKLRRFPDGNSTTVPDQIVAMLEVLTSKGPAFKTQTVTQTRIPY